ncbi:hypothetical protein GVY41_13620 [Frigidibacter albus]|uniref:Hedgehog/Intein (Hint) domain-containing protein n=1 Tax=Frigidibacter albus TaxID=1465486 RepID=A0A6L8VK89_9RHOB|nr:Hint domain-containing protein [Frigidibacter albus]MZQ90126.1 hypothetical protein [Frigidibacter albus]NBE32034.1 hypothetical protein [Frigidibacter albus]
MTRPAAPPPPPDGTTPALPGLAAQVFPADVLQVVAGANQGDGVAEPDLCEAGDIYRLHRSARPLRLMLCPQTGDGQAQTVAEGSDIGAPGDRVTLLSLLTLMAPDADKLEVLVIRHDASDRHFALPLSPVAPRTDYTLLTVSPPPPDVRLSDMVCVSFTRGTMIAMAGGAQKPVEQLVVGDRVLTRDNGPQAIRWLGHATLRASGSFAPVVISRGTLGNAGDLIVSQHHRIFLYQRGEQRVGGTAELLVQAKHLVDGESIWLREGGFVDYFSLVFDHHEIIYAEGIPCESLLVSEATLSLLPQAFSAEVRARFPGLSQRQHFGTEASRTALDAIGRDALLRGRRRD